MVQYIEREHPSGFTYIAPTVYFAPGDIIAELGDVPASAQDPRRLQLGRDHFILPPQIAHACEPAAYIDWSTLTLRALRPIEADEETPSPDSWPKISYHFGTSERDGYPAFECLCGSWRASAYSPGMST